MVNSIKEYAYKMRRVVQICDSRPDFLNVLNKVRKDAKKLSNPISVDLTSRCNLFCEGCYYYAGNAQAMTDENDTARWQSFFAEQKKKNVKFIYVGGAEAALHPERIEASAENIPYGIIAANGTVKISKDIPYRIAVSVWGSPDVTAKLRGGGTFWKAIRNYAKDPRAVFIYTINSQNIDQMRECAEIFESEGAKLTFNMYSPTESYLSKIERGMENDKEFFRFSSKEDNLAFTPETLQECRAAVDELIDQFPGTICYPKSFNHQMTEPGPVFQLDPETGLALDCAGRHNGTHRTYLSTLKESTNKCCMPNLDCASCRLLATVLPSRLMPRDSDVKNEDTVREWLNACQYWAWFYLNEPYTQLKASERTPMRAYTMPEALPAAPIKDV